MVCGLTKNNNGWKHNLNLFFLYGFKLCCAATKTFHEIQSKGVQILLSQEDGLVVYPQETCQKEAGFCKAHATTLHSQPPTLQKIKLGHDSAHLHMLPLRFIGTYFTWLTATNNNVWGTRESLMWAKRSIFSLVNLKKKTCPNTDILERNKHAI